MPILAKELRQHGWIAFSRVTERGDWDLFLMRPDGSQQRNLSRTADHHEIGARFSPDGRRMLFRRMPKSEKFTHDDWGSVGQLVVANADGTNQQVLGADGELAWASWSPDGTAVATLTRSGIEVRDIATRKLVRKFDRQGVYQQLYWSADGRWLTGTANSQGESWTVVRLSAETGAINPVNRYQNCTPDWFPDSNRVIFSSRPANQGDDGGVAVANGQSAQYGWTQLWMANGDGTGRQLLFGEDGRHVYGGAVSPDGKYVLFTTSTADGGEVGSEIRAMRLSDAPTIAGKSVALRRAHPKTKDGPVLTLAPGWEPHWTLAEIPTAGGRGSK